MTFNGAGILLASCATTTVTATATVASATSKNYAICIKGSGGGCQNDVNYDTTINPSGVDAITILGDITTNPNGQSYQNITCSGGANNFAISSQGNYVGGANSGGTFQVLHVQITGSPSHLQVVNTGYPAINIPCPAQFGLAPADDQAAYYLGNNSGSVQTQLYKETWNSGATASTANDKLCIGGTIGGCTTPADFALCPGIYPLTINGNVIENFSEIQMDTTDNLFVETFGTVATQGFNHIAAMLNVSTGGCATVNLYTGDVYSNCTIGTAGDSCSTELPSQTLLTGGNTCWGIPTYTGFADTSDGKNFTTHNGSNFGFTSSQTLSLHCQSSGNCTASAIPLTSPAGFNCAVATVHCQFAMSSVSGSGLVLSSTATAAQLGCASFPCTVQYAVLNGVHGVDESGDGSFTWISFGSQGGWGVSGFSKTTATACSQGNPGASGSSQATYLNYNKTAPIGFSRTTQWANSLTSGTCSAGSCTWTSGAQWQGHPSMGQSTTVSAFFTGFTTRSNSNLLAWTIFTGGTSSLFVDTHGTYPHFVNGTGATPNDNGPWFQMSDSPQTPTGNGPCGNPTYCPIYMNLVAYAVYPTTVYPSGTNPTLFFHNFNCGNASGSRCNDGVAAGFEEVNSISSTDPLGRYMIWGCSMLHGLGKDSGGNPVIALCGGMLQ